MPLYRHTQYYTTEVVRRTICRREIGGIARLCARNKRGSAFEAGLGVGSGFGRTVGCTAQRLASNQDRLNTDQGQASAYSQLYFGEYPENQHVMGSKDIT